METILYIKTSGKQTDIYVRDVTILFLSPSLNHLLAIFVCLHVKCKQIVKVVRSTKKCARIRSFSG